jgi:hypothetical protein
MDFSASRIAPSRFSHDLPSFAVTRLIFHPNVRTSSTSTCFFLQYPNTPCQSCRMSVAQMTPGRNLYPTCAATISFLLRCHSATAPEALPTPPSRTNAPTRWSRTLHPRSFPAVNPGPRTLSQVVELLCFLLPLRQRQRITSELPRCFACVAKSNIRILHVLISVLPPLVLPLQGSATVRSLPAPWSSLVANDRGL